MASRYAPLPADELPPRPADEIASPPTELQQQDDAPPPSVSSSPPAPPSQPPPTPSAVHRGSVSEGSALAGTISKHEHEAALAEVTKLHQVISSAKAVANAEEPLMRVLSTADDGPESDPQMSSAVTAAAPR
jgi:hypothetical protein